MLKVHWNDQVVKGPDPGIRYNARIGRFIKSYLNFIPWKDNLIYAQAQKYWILNNWMMIDLNLGDKEKCREITKACTDYLLSAQTPDGYWEYPNPEWKNRIATVEGNYAAMGLLESFFRIGDERYLIAAKKWYDFAVNRIGFQKKNGMLAINYFYNNGTGMVPNNSASALCMFAMLMKATDDKAYLETCEGMVTWLINVQLDSGELPYAVAGPESAGQMDRVHFLCYQYNAFQFLNLAKYHNLTKDNNIWPVLEKLAKFISRCVTPIGAVWYDCNHERPDVPYYSTAVGAALSLATDLGIGDYHSVADLTFERMISLLSPEKGLKFHSKGNYGILSDKRSYPRYLSMILNHILLRVKGSYHVMELTK